MNVTVDPPARLPVEYLSLSSLKQFMMCPEKWRRRYIEKEYEPPSGKMLLGSAAGASLAQHYGHQIETGEGLCAEAVLDEFSTEWEDRISREEVEWGDARPGELKDLGAGALKVYHRQFAPQIEPVGVEREFELRWPGVDWTLTGFIDLEDAAGLVRDYKTGKRVTKDAANADLQATVYCAARRAEGNPAAGFTFDNLILNKQPTADVITTMRSDRQLDLLTDRIFGLAREIDWRCETGIWSGAPVGTWFCQTCRYANCPLRLGS